MKKKPEMFKLLESIISVCIVWTKYLSVVIVVKHLRGALLYLHIFLFIGMVNSLLIRLNANVIGRLTDYIKLN